MGDNTIHYEGHVRMMGAVQPFLSGAISKTVNMPEEATVEDVEALHHAVVGARPEGRRHLPRQLQGRPAAVDGEEGRHGDAGRPTPATQIVEKIVEKVVHQPVRQKLPRSACGRDVRVPRRRLQGLRHDRRVRRRPAGRDLPHRVEAGLDAVAGSWTPSPSRSRYGLQYGVPLRAFVEAFTNMRFEPAGMTDDPDIRFASSIMDYLFRRLALEYLSYDERAELGIFSIDERLQPTLPGVEEAVIETVDGHRDRRRPEDGAVGRASWPRQIELGHRRRRHRPRQHAGRRRRPPDRQVGRADVHAVRRPDEPRRLLPRLPELRQHQRLQLM